MWLQFRPKAGSSHPHKRECHSLLAVKDKLLLFGGNDTQVQVNHLMQLDPATLTWSAPRISGDIPPKRSAHSAALYDGNNMVVFGGWNGQRELNDVYILDTDTLVWKKPEVTGPLPASRHFHNGCILGDRLYVFGGYDGSQWRNDTFVLDLKTMAWNEVRFPNATLPERRASAAACPVAHNKLIIFGGYNGQHFLDDMWVLHAGKTPSDMHLWERITPPPGATWPAGRSGHSVVKFGMDLLFFCGRYREGRFNDVWSFNIETLTWTPVEVSGKPPRPRKTHSTARVGDRVILFGGHDGNTWMDDLHVFEAGPALKLIRSPPIVHVPEPSLGFDLARLAGPAVSVPNDTSSESESEGPDPVSTSSGGGLSGADGSPRRRLGVGPQSVFSDVEVVVEGHPFHLHKAILSARSEYFHHMFSSDMQETRSPRVPLQGMSLAVFKAIIKYIYTDQLPGESSFGNLVPLLLEAQRLSLPRLSLACQSVLEKNLDPHNVTSVLDVADTAGASQLKQAAVHYILKHFSVVSVTSAFLSMREDLLRMVLRERGNSNSHSVSTARSSSHPILGDKYRFLPVKLPGLWLDERDDSSSEERSHHSPPSNSADSQPDTSSGAPKRSAAVLSSSGASRAESESKESDEKRRRIPSNQQLTLPQMNSEASRTHRPVNTG